jgi:N-acyl-D-aspartate/D-glutamate deacylase
VDDLLIRGARLIDGRGGPSFRGDLAVRDGTISAMAPVLKRDAKRIIEADGLALMPGIIDSHTHFDAQVTWDPYVRPSPALGITSAVIGNCGFAIAPCKAEDRERTMRNLTQVEGMSLDVLRAGIRWDFESFSQYLAMLEGKGSAVNLAAYVGHSSVRTYVMGASATEREATPQEIDQMASLVRDAMLAGAVGLASSTSPAHNGEAGTPMPSRLASEHEHLALIRAMACQGGGVYMVTKGGQMPISFLEEMSRQSKRPVMIAALLHNSTNGGAVFNDLDAIACANQRGNPLIAQVSCCPLTMDFTLASSPGGRLSALRTQR